MFSRLFTKTGKYAVAALATTFFHPISAVCDPEFTYIDIPELPAENQIKVV